MPSIYSRLDLNLSISSGMVVPAFVAETTASTARCATGASAGAGCSIVISAATAFAAADSTVIGSCLASTAAAAIPVAPTAAATGAASLAATTGTAADLTGADGSTAATLRLVLDCTKIPKITSKRNTINNSGAVGSITRAAV